MRAHKVWVLGMAAALAACGDNVQGAGPPTSTGLEVTTAEDTPVTRDLPASASDGEPLSVERSRPAHGTVVGEGLSFTYTPEPNFHGTDGFEVIVANRTLETTVSVRITVTPVNDAPVAVADALAAAEDVTLVTPHASLIANDVDVDGDNLVITDVSEPSNGTVALAAGQVTFVPAPNFAGVAGYRYTVSDGMASSTAAVVLTVGGANDPPVAVDDVATTPSEQPLVIPAATLLANDTDPDGQVLAISAVQSPTQGTVQLVGTTVTFTPADDFVGTATFEYVVTDGIATDVGLVTVTVTAAVIECGDGDTEGTEQCDDGNAINTDGCTNQCRTGVVCNAIAFPGADRFAVDELTGHCYLSYDDEQQTFGDAAAACVASVGHLATITSAAEDALVHSVQNPAQNPWIGAAEDGNDTDAVFDWVTDEAFAYARFAAGQPDDDVGTGGSGECLHLSNAAGEWNDTNCGIATFVVGRICEVELQACGDGVVQPAASESCDDGNTTNGDGCSATCREELLAGFTFPGATGSELSVAADVTGGNLAAVPAMTRGAGVMPSVGSGAFVATGWTTGAALDLADYFTFTIAPANNFRMTLLALELDERRSNTGIRTWSVRSSVDNFATDLGVVQVPDVDATRTNHRIVLPAAFAGVTAPVELRFYGYGAEAASGSWRIDNVELVGFTTPR